MVKKALFFAFVLLVFCSSVYAAPATEEGQSIYVWPRFFQFESPWACQVYAGHGMAQPCTDSNGRYTSNTIAAQGCRITALAMLLRYHGLTSVPNSNNDPTYNTQCDDPLWAGFCQFWGIYLKTNPGRLDDWIVDKGLYDSRLPFVQSVMKNYYLNYQGQYGYHRVVPNHDCPPNITGRNCYNPAWSDTAQQMLDYDLDHERPDIMQIDGTTTSGRRYSSHFILIGGYDQKTSSYKAYDPGVSYNTGEIDPPALGKLYENHTPLRVDRYKNDIGMIGKPNISELSARVYSPVEIQIIDPQGRATGYNPATGTKVYEIPYASYSEESVSSINPDDPEQEPTKELYIDKPIAGNYILKMTGTGSGPYTIRFRGVNDDGTVNLDTSVTGTAYAGLQETYRVIYSPTGEATLSQTNNAPIANAGANQSGEQSYEIQLDGSASSDPDGDPIKYSWSVASKPSGSSATFSDTKIVNPTFTPDLAGTYTLQLIANDHWTDSAPAYVTITATPVQSRISVTPNYSKPLSAGATTLSFALNNIGRIGVSNGTLNITLADPDGTTVYSGTQTFSITAGQTKTIDVPLNIPSLKFGNYMLTYTQSDETRTGSPTTATIPNSALASFAFDKSSYRVRDTANLTLTLMNTGKFNLDSMSVTVSAPDANYTNTRTVSISPSPSPSPAGGEGVFVYAIPIPETITAGQHDATVTLSLASGSVITQNAKWGVQESSLVVGYSGTGTIAAGDILNITLENAGSVDTTYSTDKLTITDNKSNTVYRGSVSGTILAGEKKTLVDIQIPPTISSGIVYLNITLKDTKTNKLSYLTKTLTVNGLTTSLFARTDKDVYQNTEAVTAISTLAASGSNIENGTLNIKVNRIKQPSGGSFSQFIPKGLYPLYAPTDVAVGPDGSVYVVDTGPDDLTTGNLSIQKFDSNGNFKAKWGSRGTGNGQFERPRGIAVGPDGSVYVGDPWNSRIQKFDSNGNFITKWGSLGSGNGQFGWDFIGVAVASDGSVYVANNNRIQKFDSNGNFITKWGSYGSGDGQLNSGGTSYGIAVASDGSVYVTDTGNYRVQKFDSSGNFIAKWGSYGSGDGQFNYPYGIAVATDGSVYVADTWNHRIQKFDSNGNFIAKWGSRGSNNGQFYYPQGVAVASDGSVYVADTYNHRIQKFDGNGNFLTKWGSYSIAGSGDGQFYSPYGVAVASDGFIYVADNWNNRIQKFDSNGNFIAKWGSRGSGNGQFEGPDDISVDSDGFVYVADYYNRIQKFDSNGNFITTWGSNSAGIAIGPDGYVYVADRYNNRIQKFDHNGNFVSKWGSYGTGNGQLYYPRGIAIDSAGFVYVADDYDRIQKFDSNGNFVTKWGSYCYSNCSGGQFNDPTGIAVASDGSIYVGDYNCRIQKFTSNGGFLAKWGECGTSEGQFGQFNSPSSISVYTDGSIYVAGNNRIQKMSPFTSGSETLFETNISIAQPAGTSLDYTTAIGALNVTGMLYLEANLKNSLGQTIATSEYPFSITTGNTALIFNTDKTVYKSGETVTVTGQAENKSTTDATNISLVITSQKAEQGATKQTVYTNTINIPANGSYPFTFTTSATTTGTFALTGAITQNNATLAEATGQYEIASPSISVSVSAPDTADRNPFDVNVEIKNTGKVDINGQLYVGSGGSNIDYQLITIPAGEIKLFQYARQITQTTTYTIAVYGDVSASASKTVAYGEAAAIQFGVGSSGAGVKPEGMIAIPVTISNTGQLDETLSVTFTLQPQALTQTKTYFLPKSGSVTDTLYYDLMAGSYQLSAVSALPYTAANTSFTVAKENNAAMTNTVGSQGTSGLIPITVNLTNNGYNEINGSIQLAVMNNQGKAVWRGEAQVSGLKSMTASGYAINVNSAGITSGAYNTDIVLYNTSGQQLASNLSQIRISGPIFEITSIPLYATFTVGHEAALAFTVKNTGTVEGAMNLSLKATDVLNQSVAGSLMPGEEKSYIFSFTVPEDAEERDYLADYALTPVSSQGTSGQVKFHVAAVNVEVAASLDKDAYRNGDTAILTETVSNPSQYGNGDYLAIIRYGAYHDMKSFTLSSQPATLTFNVPLTEVTGENIFYSVHFTSGKTIAQKTISVNSYQPDLSIQDLALTQAGVAAYKLEAVVTNHGKTASAASSVTLYDGDPQAGGTAIAALNIPAMNPGENAAVTYNWSILGKAGEHTIYGIADPNNIVAEWSEANNITSTAVSIPNLALSLATQQPSYSANQDAGILFDIANLTSGTTYQGLKLDAAITSGAGSAVANIIKDAPTLTPATESSYGLNWNTGSTAPGDYTVSGKLTDEAGALAQSNTLFAILRTLSLNGNFTLNKDTVIQGFDLSINYALTNSGNIDLSGGEVKAEFIPSNSRQAAASYTQTFGPTAVLAAISQTIAIDKVTVEPGDYTLRLTAVAENINFVIGEKSLKVLPPLEVTKGISMQPRVLVLSDKANDAQQNPAEAVIKDILDNLGAYYKITRDMTEFKGEMRSGIYNAYLLTGKQPLIDGLDKELRERLNAGEAVILVNYEMMEDAKFREFTGVKNIGSLPAMERDITLYESPISHAGTMTVNGKIQKLEIASNSAATAGTVLEQNTAYPVIVVNTYGKGRVITFAIDAGESVKYNGVATYSLLLNNAVNYSAPGEAVMLPSYPAAIEIGIKSFGADFELKVKEKLSTNGILLTYPGAVTGEDSIAWEFKLNAGSGKKLLYLTKIDIGGTYTNTTTVEYLKNNAYERYNTYTIEITAQSLTDLEIGILSKLEGMNGAGAITEKYRAIINAPLAARQDIQKAIQDLLAVIDSLNTLGGDTNAIRLDIDSLIRVFGRRWAEASEVT